MMLNDKILKRIHSQEKGWVFCAKDLLDIGSRNNVDKILSLLAFDKKIMRIGRGVYYSPEIGENHEVKPPRIHSVAKAVANNFGFKIYPSGEKALKMLGFPIQSYDQNLYWTNSKTMKKKVGNQILYFKHNKINPALETPEAVVVVLCALSQVGKDKIDDLILQKCAKYLTKEEKPYLLRMPSRVPVWIANIIPKILDIN